MSNTGPVETGRVIRQRSSRKERLARNLANWPMLRLMVTSVAFRSVILGFILLLAMGALLLLKIWRVSPPGMLPVERISLLDHIQAWSLTRNAQKAEARGDYENALSAWRAAAANNSGDAQALRKCLITIPQLPKPSDYAQLAHNVAQRLMRLTQPGITNAKTVLSTTNRADLQLIATVWNRCGMYGYTARLLSQKDSHETETLNRLRAIALFRNDQVGGFMGLVRSNPQLAKSVLESVGQPTAAASSPADAEWRAVCLAYLAGWGKYQDVPATVQQQAEEELAVMAQAPATETLARELQMMVFLQKEDLEACRKVYSQLEASGRVTIPQQIGYWRLVAAVQGKAAAIKLVREANPVPKTDPEVIRLVSLYAGLGLLDEADQLCQRYLNAPPWLEEGALLRSDILIDLKKWQDLRQLAFRIRSFPTLMEELGGFSYFIEGIAEYNEGYKDNAVQRFDQLTDRPDPTGGTNKTPGLKVPDLKLATRVAQGMVESPRNEKGEPKYEIGNGRFAKQAQGVLDKYRGTAAETNSAYLTALLKVAYHQRDATNVWTAISRLYDIAPNNAQVVHNYAATQLLLRTNVEQALVHTLSLLQVPEENRDVLLSRILNHAIALTMNGRLDEAETNFARVLLPMSSQNADAPPPELQSEYHLGMFELRFKQGRYAEALQEKNQIQTSQLFPEQIKWLEDATLQIEEAQAKLPKK